MTFLVLEFDFDASKELSKLIKLNLFAHSVLLPLLTIFAFFDQELRPTVEH